MKPSGSFAPFATSWKLWPPKSKKFLLTHWSNRPTDWPANRPTEGPIELLVGKTGKEALKYTSLYMVVFWRDVCSCAPEISTCLYFQEFRAMIIQLLKWAIWVLVSWMDGRELQRQRVKGRKRLKMKSSSAKKCRNNHHKSWIIKRGSFLSHFKTHFTVSWQSLSVFKIHNTHTGEYEMYFKDQEK